MQNRLLFVGALLFAGAFLPYESIAQEKGSAKAPPLAVAPFNATAAREHQEAWAKHIGQPREAANSIGMKLTLIPAGEFMMGSGESAEKAAAFYNRTYQVNNFKAVHFEGEYPQHRVRITRPFYLGTYHVTRGQFRQFVADTGYKTDAEKGFFAEQRKKVITGTPAGKPSAPAQPLDDHSPVGQGAHGWNPAKEDFDYSKDYNWRNAGFDQTDEHPVVNVSWNDAVAFCQWLSRKEGKTYRLPTEAEWEYACRAGTTTRYWCGDDAEKLAKVANVADATTRTKLLRVSVYAIKASDGYAFTSPVGSFQHNPFGLYDMHGNVWQWCSDQYDEHYYAGSPTDDPTGYEGEFSRVRRGGSFISWPGSLSASGRAWDGKEGRYHDWGFRVAGTN